MTGSRALALAVFLAISVTGCSSHRTEATVESTDAPSSAPEAANDSSTAPAAGESTAAAAAISSTAPAPSDVGSSIAPATSSPGDPQSAVQADPAHIAVYVTPYYNSNGPTIQIGSFSSGLASNDQSVFLTTIAAMKQQWQQLSFPMVYVGAIRLYDLGYRDEAVYWFYTAQYRGRQFDALADPAKIGQMGDPAFELQAAADSFFTLTGPWFNGYAFKDIDRLIAVIRRVRSEGRQLPDLETIYPGVTFIAPEQRQKANDDMASGMDELLTNFDTQRASMKQQREQNGTETRFAPITSKELP